MDLPKYPITAITRQSPPVDFYSAYDQTWAKGKTVLITGGASGLGKAFLQKLASLSTTVVIGDINTEEGERVVQETKKATKNENLHFFQCDVTDWNSQVNFFKKGVEVSPHKGIDVVIANAGIADKLPAFDNPVDLDGENPPPPSLKCVDVNLTGVLYTTHLATFYLPRNPGSSKASPDAVPKEDFRDRQLILVGSMASLVALPGQTLYSVGKHAVLGLFRNMRTISFTTGIRVNMILPYFVDTPLVGPPARIMLAGGGLGKVEDVVEVVTRFIADSRIVGRAAAIGPRMKLVERENGEWTFEGREGDKPAKEVAIWDAHAEDHEDSDSFIRKIVVLMNRFMIIQGWSAWIKDVTSITVKGLLGRK